MDKIKTEQVSWNLSQFLIIQMSELLQNASLLYYNRQFYKCFLKLKCVRMRLVPYLQDTEVTTLKNSEEEIQKCYGAFQGSKKGFAQPDEKAARAFRSLQKELDDYNDNLMGLLRQYGLLIAMKEDKTQMNA